MSADMSGQGAAGTPSSEADVYNLYALCLGRHPEAIHVVGNIVGHDLGVMLTTFFATDEHAANVLEPLGSDRRLVGGLFDRAPGGELMGWTARVLPLAQQTRQALQQEACARSWHAAYHALFSDPVWAEVTDHRLVERRRGVLSALQTFAGVEGRVERAAADEISGWALMPEGSGDPLTVSARIDGKVVALAAACGYRRDLQERFGGSGLCEFRLTLPDRLVDSGRTLRVEIHEASTGVRIDAATFAPHAAPLSVHAAVVAELASVRQTLARLESSLPALDREFGFELGAYMDWRRAFGERTPKPLRRPQTAEADAHVLVVIDARQGSSRWLDDALDGLARQTHSSWSTMIVGQGAEAEDLARRAAWRTGRPVELMGEAEAAARALAPGIELVVRIDAACVLEPGALAALVEQDLASALALYWDEDAFADCGPSGIAAARRARTGPRFKTAFDLDWLRQEPVLGSGLALTPSALTAIGEGPWSAASPSQTGLRLAETEVEVRHLPRLLHSRQAAETMDPAAWAAAVQAHLDRQGEDAEAVVMEDALGAGAAVDVRHRRDLSDVTAAVIIPTKDGLDVLRPCLDSLFQRSGANAVAMQVLVVDHESREPETLAYLDDLAGSGRARVLPYSGGFNWALMNNLAAAEVEADVLVFLNNDTEAVSADWLDRLCRQAMRPEVGPVGARLIFPDGAIQHAGFVARDLDDSFLMPEGVGVPGSDGGYLGRHARRRRTAAVTGACMAIRAELFRELGGFDAANLPVDWNDIDLCLKARAAGFQTLYDPASVLYHHESRSRGATLGGERLAASGRAATLVWERWGERFGQDPDYNPHFERSGTPFARLAPPWRPASVA